MGSDFVSTYCLGNVHYLEKKSCLVQAHRDEKEEKRIKEKIRWKMKDGGDEAHKGGSIT